MFVWAFYVLLDLQKRKEKVLRSQKLEVFYSELLAYESYLAFGKFKS
jgi:hypothetical protein